MTSTYSTLLFDLDHTLLDSAGSEAAAFDQTLRRAGADQPDQYFDTYDRINRGLWAALERGETTADELRTTRFEMLIAETDLCAEPRAMADDFTAGLGANGELYAGAREALDAVFGQASLALLTNGLSDVQRARIERLDLVRYFDAVVISAEVGAAKPGTRIFDIAFAQLGSPPKPTAPAL